MRNANGIRGYALAEHVSGNGLLSGNRRIISVHQDVGINQRRRHRRDCPVSIPALSEQKQRATYGRESFPVATVVPLLGRNVSAGREARSWISFAYAQERLGWSLRRLPTRFDRQA